MKKIIAIVAFVALIVSCKEKQVKENVYKNYPENLTKVLKKHGGLENWKLVQVLSFKKGEEEHTTDMHTRKAVVNSPKYNLGYNGNEVWLSQKDSTAFKGDPAFYYNLYFYFYAMPFVLADDGIVYEETKPISFNGKEYPGYKISYKSNVGISPDDNYLIYFDPETYQMEWLKYSVTYFSKKTSDKFNLIKYNKWENVNGFSLPAEITWFQQDENGNPTAAAKDPVKFTSALASQAKLADSFYNKPVTE